jgi:hypothetical protein
VPLAGKKQGKRQLTLSWQLLLLPTLAQTFPDIKSVWSNFILVASLLRSVAAIWRSGNT